MPLMMPAAVTGIQIICTAQIVTPAAPNKATFTIIIKATPCHEYGV